MVRPERRVVLVRTSRNPPDDVAHAPTRSVSRLFSTLRREATQRSESERRQEWRRGTQSACTTSLPKKSGEKCGLADERSVRVSAGAPGSRLQPGGEIRPRRAECRKPLKRGEQGSGPQQEVNAAASSNYQPKGVGKGRAGHVTAKATRLRGPAKWRPETTSSGSCWPSSRTLLTNSPAQRCLARLDSPEFLAVWRAEPALCGLPTGCISGFSLLTRIISRATTIEVPKAKRC